MSETTKELKLVINEFNEKIRKYTTSDREVLVDEVKCLKLHLVMMELEDKNSSLSKWIWAKPAPAQSRIG